MIGFALGCIIVIALFCIVTYQNERELAKCYAELIAHMEAQMSVIPGDWVEREWRVGRQSYIDRFGGIGLAPMRDGQAYADAVHVFDVLCQSHDPGDLALLQERQFIPDDQCWGEWVTIMKSEGIPE